MKRFIGVSTNTPGKPDRVPMPRSCPEQPSVPPMPKVKPPKPEERKVDVVNNLTGKCVNCGRLDLVTMNGAIFIDSDVIRRIEVDYIHRDLCDYLEAKFSAKAETEARP